MPQRLHTKGLGKVHLGPETSFLGLTPRVRWVVGEVGCPSDLEDLPGPLPPAEGDPPRAQQLRRRRPDRGGERRATAATAHRGRQVRRVFGHLTGDGAQGLGPSGQLHQPLQPEPRVPRDQAPDVVPRVVDRDRDDVGEVHCLEPKRPPE